MEIMVTVLAFLVAIAVLIVVHELGHYWVAVRCGVRVLRFSVGFGKPLWRWQRHSQSTEWVISAVPFGGYVKMLDENDPDCSPMSAHDLPYAFNRQSVWRRSAIVAAGPIANFLLAIALYWVLNLIGGQELVPYLSQPKANTVAAAAGIKDGDRVLAVDDQAVSSWGDFQMRVIKDGMARRAAHVRVQRLEGDTVDLLVPLERVASAEIDETWLDKSGLARGAGAAIVQALDPQGVGRAAGLQVGDRILAIDGQHLRSASELSMAVRANQGQVQNWDIERAGAANVVRLAITPALLTLSDGTRIRRVGIDLQVWQFVRYGPLAALNRALGSTWDTSVMTVRMVGRMVAGESSWRNVSGALTVADFAGQAARVGLVAYCSFLAFVSISLGVLNLLPIPVLDGGHLLYYAVEITKGSPVSARFMALAQRAGVVLLVGLTGLALFNDLTRLLS